MMNLIDHGQRDFDQICRDFKWRIPQRFNLAIDVCDRHVARGLGDRIALYFEARNGNTREVTFGELKSLSDRFANALRGLGIERGDRVAIILPQRLEAAIAHLAIYKLGAIALPLAKLFGPDAVRYRLENSGTRLVITDGSHMDMLLELASELPALETILNCDLERGRESFWAALTRGADDIEVVDTSSEDPALLIYTSGTTGPPKGALNAHRCLLGTLTGFEMSHNFYPKPGDLLYTPADWAWAGGLLDGLLPGLHFAVPVVGYEGGKFDPEHCLHLMGRYQVRNTFLPPTAMRMMMQVSDPVGRHKVQLRSIMSAGEQVGVEVLNWANEVLGVKLNEMWGQTESNYIAGSCAEIMEVRPGAIGKSYPGHQVEVIDDAGDPVAPGEMGEFAALRGDPVMILGYWDNETATRAKYNGDQDQWWCTGDVGYKDEDGYLWFMGRKDDVISSAGHRIGPGEVEDCLLKHPAVANAAVIGAPDALRGQIVKAFIVLADGQHGSQALVQDIQDSVRARLAAYEYPRAIEFIDELPMTTTGKVRRLELRERELARQAAEQSVKDS